MSEQSVKPRHLLGTKIALLVKDPCGNISDAELSVEETINLIKNILGKSSPRTV